MRIRVLASGLLNFKAVVPSESNVIYALGCTTSLCPSRPQGNQQGKGTHDLLHAFLSEGGGEGVKSGGKGGYSGT
jgi:hypothetical protein